MSSELQIPHVRRKISECLDSIHNSQSVTSEELETEFRRMFPEDADEHDRELKARKRKHTLRHYLAGMTENEKHRFQADTNT